VTAAILGSAFRLEDVAEMLGEPPAMLLPAVQEAVDPAIMTAAENTFAFRHQLLRRAVGELIPRPARQALHRQYGELLLSRGESAHRAASHLLQAAHIRVSRRRWPGWTRRPRRHCALRRRRPPSWPCAH
jgi:predicted ATPase